MKSSLIILTFAMMVTQTGTGLSAQDKTTIRVEAMGFEITHPVPGWVARQTAPQADAVMVKITREKTNGKVEATIVAMPASNLTISDEDRRDQSLDSIAGRDGFSNRSKAPLRVGGRELPGLKTDWQVNGITYRLQQAYLTQNGTAYTIAIHSPVEQFDDEVNDLLAVVDTFRTIPINRKLTASQKRQRLVARCGSEVRWAQSWEQASRMAQQENKAILVLIRSQTGFDITDAIATTTLMDQDIIELLNQHCIVFSYRKGMDVPFNSYDKYGIGPSSFGNTMLLVHPDGTVLGDTFSYHPVTFYDFLLQTLKEKILAVEPPDHLAEPMKRAAWYAARGNLSAALDELRDLNSAESLRLTSSLLRRQRNLVDAVVAIDAAIDQANSPVHRAEIELDRCQLRLLSGQMDLASATELFRKFLSEHPQHPRGSEVQYLLGLCHLASNERDKAESTWTSLIDSSNNQDRWCWQAAAVLESTGYKMGAIPSFQIPGEEVIRNFRAVPFETVAKPELDQLQQEAIEYLLGTQQENGSWISPPDALGPKGYSTRPFTIAVTSICARSLIPHRATPEVEASIDRAFDCLVQIHQLMQQQSPRKFYMDYSPWSDAYLLRFLAKYAEIRPQRREQIATLVDDTLAGLAQSQKEGGGWSYYISHSLANTDQPSNQSISFMTAAVTVALLETRVAGFEVSSELTGTALDCLERMRNQNQTFTYFLWHDREDQGRLSAEEGAAGRGPLCSLALRMGDRGDETAIAQCLELFLKYSHLYARERGKSLMHAAPGGQGSHYLMFDYSWAAEALAQLPDEEAGRFRQGILDAVLTSRSQAGSYLDNPINGWHYGTGMALETFNLLQTK